MPKNIVILSDGSGNDPAKDDPTNVVRLLGMLEEGDDQIVWYDAGVGTAGSTSGLTAVGRLFGRIGGAALGFGLKKNVLEAYTFLMYNHEPGDRIYLFGFSRGAYSARALAGLLYQVGLLRRGQENMMPYALKLFWWRVGRVSKERKKERMHKSAQKFSEHFSRRDFQRGNRENVRYVGLWDTVKAMGYLRPNISLPDTNKMDMAPSLAHAVSIDERRWLFMPKLIAPDAEGFESGGFKEVWFAGVHSDVGGTFGKGGLADITLGWIVADAAANGLKIEADEFAEFRPENQQADLAEGAVHDNASWWKLFRAGYRRKIRPGAVIHESVKVRMDRTAGTRRPYEPRLPEEKRWEPWPRQGG